MTLQKQLWLSFALFILVAFGGSFVVSCLSAKAYLEEHLFRKNIDNAAALAITLSSQQQEETLIQLYISSQFDTGHYQFINLVDMKGNTIAKQFDQHDFKEAPQWFMALFPIRVKPGVAQVSNGWQQIGTLTLSSHVKFAYRELWKNATQLFFYFIVILLVGGVAGNILLRRLIKPLHKAVDHAHAIGERRFITTTEPRTKEFKTIIGSLNNLSARVKKMLQDESVKLKKLQSEAEVDTITGLLNRKPLLAKCHSLLHEQRDHGKGTCVLIRVDDLFHLNQQLGHLTMDKMLTQFGQAFKRLEKKQGKLNGFSGRLNGSDFLLVHPSVESNGEEVGNDVLKTLQRVCLDTGLTSVKIFAAGTHYFPEENVSEILSRLDSIILNSVTGSCVFADIEMPAVCNIETKDWTTYLQSAILDNRFELDFYPVVSNSGELIHMEAPLRLVQNDGSLIHAASFLPHVNRLQMGSQLDLRVLELALQAIEKSMQPIAIHFSAGILTQPQVMNKIVHHIQENSSITHLLSIEMPEYVVFQYLDEFKAFCQLLAPLPCHLGIEHFCQELKTIGELHELGLNYIKIDRSLIHKIHEAKSYHVLLNGLCIIAHSLGLLAIAEGVEENAEWERLLELGFDGGTGVFFSDN